MGWGSAGWVVGKLSGAFRAHCQLRSSAARSAVSRLSLGRRGRATTAASWVRFSNLGLVPARSAMAP